jgi:hypothetical protein
MPEVYGFQAAPPDRLGVFSFASPRGLGATVDRGRDTCVPGTPRTDPDGRSLAHPVLISALGAM